MSTKPARRNILAARQEERVTLASDDALPAVPLVYDYSQIPLEHRDQVRTDTAYVKAGMQRTSKEMLEWGTRLNRIKANTEHGQFGAILETELGFASLRLPQMWMAAAKRLADKNENFSQLPASALYLLGAESTPDEAIEQIGQRIDAGEQLTLKDVETTVAELKRPAPYTLTLDETIKLIWQPIKLQGTLLARLEIAKTLNRSDRFSHRLQTGQQLDPGTFQRAWATVVGELEGQIEHARKQREQAALYQQRTLADAAAEPAPEPSHPRTPELPVLASVSELKAALLRWLPETFEDEADWIEVAKDITQHGVGAYPTLKDALPQHFHGLTLCDAAEAIANELGQQGPTPQPVFTPAIMRQVVVMPVNCPECGEVTDLHEDGVAYACDECGYGHPKPAHGEPDPVDMRAITERLQRINQIRITFARCLEAFSEYSELTGDFASATVPKLGIHAMDKKLKALSDVLEES